MVPIPFVPLLAMGMVDVFVFVSETAAEDMGMSFAAESLAAESLTGGDVFAAAEAESFATVEVAGGIVGGTAGGRGSAEALIASGNVATFDREGVGDNNEETQSLVAAGNVATYDRIDATPGDLILDGSGFDGPPLESELEEETRTIVDEPAAAADQAEANVAAANGAKANVPPRRGPLQWVKSEEEEEEEMEKVWIANHHSAAETLAEARKGKAKMLPHAQDLPLPWATPLRPWLGPNPWEPRLRTLWHNAIIETPISKIPELDLGPPLMRYPGMPTPPDDDDGYPWPNDPPLSRGGRLALAGAVLTIAAMALGVILPHSQFLPDRRSLDASGIRGAQKAIVLLNTSDLGAADYDRLRMLAITPPGGGDAFSGDAAEKLHGKKSQEMVGDDDPCAIATLLIHAIGQTVAAGLRLSELAFDVPGLQTVEGHYISLDEATARNDTRAAFLDLYNAVYESNERAHEELTMSEAQASS